jgi:hypothetical protein
MGDAEGVVVKTFTYRALRRKDLRQQLAKFGYFFRAKWGMGLGPPPKTIFSSPN